MNKCFSEQKCSGMVNIRNEDIAIQTKDEILY